MNYPLIIDGHLDLSMNAMQWNRDIRKSVNEIRTLEAGLNDKPDRGNNTVSLPEMRKGNIGLCFATLIARYAKPSHPLGGCQSPEQAWATVQGQLAWYNEMERQGEMFMIKSKLDLDTHLKKWSLKDDDKAVGFLMTLEGADSIVTFDHLYLLHAKGLRAIGPAHYGPGTYAYGTNSEGSIGIKGKKLLSIMDELGIVLDATHLCDTSFWESMDNFQGRIWASHSNCRAIVNHNRQFSDEQLLALIERGAVIGIPLDAWMMVPNWVRGKSHPGNTKVDLDTMVDHISHICQLSGNSNHVAIGTDLDGGFGKEQGPSDLNTIADLQKLPTLLKQRGFMDNDIDNILHHNWIKILNDVLK